MKTIMLDISNIQTVKALHIYLAYRLDLPAYYGKNLDALHDVLCEESNDVRIMLAGAPASAEMAAYLPRLVCVMEESARENAHLCFEQI
ncbi:MAG: barstar family protein [Clostridia bacterium]|nr:barstar family protein [Clostridia bacterium]